MLLLDSAGRVISANASAGALWPGQVLGGGAFPALFVCDIVSDDPAFREAQWEAFLATAVDRWMPLEARTPGSSTGRPTRVRLEACPAGPTAYIAVVRPVVAPAAPSPGPEANDAAGAFRLLAGAGAAGFFDLDLQRGQVHLSPTWKSMLGYGPDEIADTVAAWRELMHPDDSAAAPDRAGRRTQIGPRSISVEYRMRHRQGHWVWIHCFGLQIVGAEGVVNRVAGLHLDISERKELEDTLIASETRLNALAAEGPLAAFELDFTRAQFWFSPAWERLLGYAPGELPATAASFAAALPAEAADAGAAEWLLQHAPERAVLLEPVRLRARDGREIPVLLGVNRVISRKRELLRAFGFACPAPALPPGEERGLTPGLAEHALHTAAEGLLVTDARGRIVFLNTTAARLLGIEAAAAAGRPVGEVFRLVNRHSGRPADDPVDAALNADQPLPLSSAESLVPVPSGAAPLPVVWTVRTARGPDGNVAGLVIVFRNPDEMSLTPEELVKANRFEKLALAAGGIAHDFNNLLTTILGTISLAQVNHSLASLADAEKSCLVAKGLSRQLLAFARGGNGSVTVCSPGELLGDTVKIAAPDTSAVVTVEVAPGTGNIRVERPQLLQVFQNLVVNALQAMPPPPHPAQVQLRAAGVTLAERQVPGLPAGEYIAFEVRDNGTGIKPEHVEKIFDPFFTTKKHGTGLGLATVLSLVRKHGGQITLDTQVGVGTLFTVYLPRAEEAVEVQARRAPSLRFGTGRVLFMDDDPGITALTATMLESLNYQYDLAKNGEEAIALYRRYLNVGRPYDAVILDLTIVGGMGGEQCFQELRSLDPEVRAIVASGYDDDELARQFLEKGFCGYLAKPYRVGDLGKTLKAVLG